jgi:hypothetical protein
VFFLDEAAAPRFCVVSGRAPSGAPGEAKARRERFAGMDAASPHVKKGEI